MPRKLDKWKLLVCFMLAVSSPQEKVMGVGGFKMVNSSAKR